MVTLTQLPNQPLGDWQISFLDLLSQMTTFLLCFHTYTLPPPSNIIFTLLYLQVFPHSLHKALTCTVLHLNREHH